MREIMQQIQQLQQGLLEINAPYLARMPKSQMGIKGKNDARMNRKNNECKGYIKLYSRNDLAHVQDSSKIVVKVDGR